MAKKITKDEFLRRAKQLHGDRYDYSEVQFTNMRTEVVILCPVHGIFKQPPKRHLKSGCRKCAYAQMGEDNRIDETEFKRRASSFHKNKYDYSKFRYVSFTSKTAFYCPKHGMFEQTPKGHLRGGCKVCGKGVAVKKNKTKKIDAGKGLSAFPKLLQEWDAEKNSNREPLKIGIAM